LACLGCTALQKGPLWWASHHRHHHCHSDGPEDVHSPVTGGLLWSHLGWFFDTAWDRGDPEAVKDLSRLPALRGLDRVRGAPALLLAAWCLPRARKHKAASAPPAGWRASAPSTAWRSTPARARSAGFRGTTAPPRPARAAPSCSRPTPSARRSAR